MLPRGGGGNGREWRRLRGGGDVNRDRHGAKRETVDPLLPDLEARKPWQQGLAQ